MAGRCRGTFEPGNPVTVQNALARGLSHSQSSSDGGGYGRASIAASDVTFLVLFDADSTRAVLSNEDVRNAIRGRALLNVAATSPDEVIGLAKMVATQEATSPRFVLSLTRGRSRAGGGVHACPPTAAWSSVGARSFPTSVLRCTILAR